MSEVLRYLIQKTPIGTMMKPNPEGNWIAAKDFDRVTAERDAALAAEQIAIGAVAHGQLVIKELQQRLTAADERADVLESEVARLNRVKLSLMELADSRSDNCSVYRQHLTVALALAEKVRDASLGMQRKFLADLIDHLHQIGSALNPAEGGGDEA